MSDGQDTQVREPAEPRLYGLLPHVLVLVLGAAAIGAAAGFLIRGNAVLGSLLLGAGVIGLLLYVQEAIRRRASPSAGPRSVGSDIGSAFWWKLCVAVSKRFVARARHARARAHSRSSVG
jgi:hypothetical protein